MLSKKQIERKVDHLEEKPGESPEDLIFEDLKGNFAELEGKNSSKIKIEDEGNWVYELLNRIHKAME